MDYQQFTKRITTVLGVLILVPLMVIAQSPIKIARTITISTTEGTGMNVDISPDGRTLAFDLLGEIFIMPVNGGKAKQLTRGIAVNAKPVWSPDGKYLAILTDLDEQMSDFKLASLDFGSDKMYLKVIDTFGVTAYHLKSIPANYYGTMSEAHWSSDQKSIFFWGRRYFLDGRIIEKPKELSPIIVTLTSKEKSVFLKKNSSSEPAYDIVEYDNIQNQSATISLPFSLPVDSVCNVRVSKNYPLIAFLKGYLPGDGGNDFSGRIHELQIYNYKDKTLKFVRGLDIRYMGDLRYQRYTFSDDGRYLYLAYKGQIHQINIATLENKIMPFKADIQVRLGPENYNRVKVDNKTVKATFIRSAQTRPDGKQQVFSALNRVYVRDVKSGKTQLLCSQDFTQSFPAYSPDGQWIAYVSYYDSLGTGDVWKVKSTGGAPQKITNEMGKYIRPTWFPDGKSVVVLKNFGSYLFSDEHVIEKIDAVTGSVVQLGEAAGGAAPVRVLDNGESISFLDKKAYSVFTSKDKYGNIYLARLNSILKNETKVIAIARGRITAGKFEGLQLSPDKKYLIYQGKLEIFLTKIDPATSEPSLVYNDSLGAHLPVIRITKAGVDPNWEENGKVISWVFGNNYYRARLTDIIKAYDLALSKTNKSSKYDWFQDIDLKKIQTQLINVEVPYQYGKGLIALTGAKIISMAGDQIIERGVIIAKDGRILSVGSMENITVPKNAQIIDCRGKVIIPGLIDAHFHGGKYTRRDFNFRGTGLIDLAYGVTTVRDPSGNFPLVGLNELIGAGRFIGPRFFGVGQALRDDQWDVLSRKEASRIVENIKTLGGIAIKQYEYRPALPRHWLHAAAKEANINITHEGPELLLAQIALIKQGTTGIEHSPNWGEVYDDVIQFYARSNIYLTPTQYASLNSINNDPLTSLNYFHKWRREHPESKYERFIDSSSADYYNSIKIQPSDSSYFMEDFRTIARLMKNKVNIAASSHGNIPALGLHYEMLTYCMGGATPFEALKTATITAAAALGMADDLGSLTKGKIADLLILDKDPLLDITNAKSIKYIMKDGILYEGDSLDIKWPFQRKTKVYNVRQPD